MTDTIMPSETETILIIDDDRIVFEMLTEFLTERGYRTVHGKTGGEGLKLVREMKPKLVLLDKNLPDMSWNAVAKGIWDFNQHTRIIIITAYASQESIMESMEMGVSQYLEKPFPRLDVVSDAIEKALRNHRLRLEFEKQQKSLRETADRLRELSQEKKRMK